MCPPVHWRRAGKKEVQLSLSNPASCASEVSDRVTQAKNIFTQKLSQVVDFFKDLIYLQTQREAETEGEAGSMQGAGRGTRSWAARITPQAAGSAKPLRHRGCPRWWIFLAENCADDLFRKPSLVALMLKLYTVICNPFQNFFPPLRTFVPGEKKDSIIFECLVWNWSCKTIWALKVW